MNNIDGPATILECVGKPESHWLGVRLEGTVSNRAAIGAVVRLTVAGATQARRLRASYSFASHGELLARFGLGASTTVERLEVEWPTGKVEVYPVDGVDRVVVLRESEPETE